MLAFEACRGANMSGMPSASAPDGSRAPRQMLGIVSKALACIDDSLLQGPSLDIQPSVIHWFAEDMNFYGFLVKIKNNSLLYLGHL